MSDLASALADLGCSGVRTYIQSGNVVFRTPSANAKRVPQLIEEWIAKRFGFRAPVVLRTSVEFQAVVAGNPFLKAGAEPASLHVGFLADPPSPRKVAALDSHRSPGDSFQVRAREIYLSLPNGVARSKLTGNYFESQLGATITVRNWRTVLALWKIAQEMA